MSEVLQYIVYLHPVCYKVLLMMLIINDLLKYLCFTN